MGTVSGLFKELEKGNSLVRITKLADGYKELILSVNFTDGTYDIHTLTYSSGATSGVGNSVWPKLSDIEADILKDIVTCPQCWYVKLPWYN